jgi:hypothetical protein
MLDQVGLNDVLNRIALFADRCRETVYTDGATIKLVDNRFEKLAVHEIEPLRVDF